MQSVAIPGWWNRSLGRRVGRWLVISARSFGLATLFLVGFNGKLLAGEWPIAVDAFLRTHCFECHNGDAPAGNLHLHGLSRDLGDARNLQFWTLVHDRITSREMPPQDAAQPAEADRERALNLLAASLHDADQAGRETVLRRLNRREYEHTVRDLFEIDVDVSRLLPDDSLESDFDTIGSLLSLSSEQMVRYIEAADLVLDQVFGRPRPTPTIHKTVNFATTPRGTDKSERKLSDGVVLFSGAKHLPLYDASLPELGTYRIRVKIRAEQSEHPVVMHVVGGNTGSIAGHTVGFFEAHPNQTSTVEFIDRAVERSDCLSFGLVGGFPWWSVDTTTYQGAGLFLGDIEIEGPIESWPPSSRAKLFGQVDPEQGTVNDIRAILERVLPRVFRRAVEGSEIESFVAIAEQGMEQGASWEHSLRRALKGALCAPEFLFLEERSTVAASGDEEASGRSTSPLDDYAIASRLSYFLWSSLPDDELFELARRGKLADEGVLRDQVERLLDDPKSQRFVQDFTGQWLRLRDIDFTVPNELLYPEYNQLLRQSMLDETHAFVGEILARDLSVQNFIAADFAMINRPLAEFYGIAGVDGLAIRKVDLPSDSVRGGLLTQASVLKVSADGTRTSPVLRGAWILKHMYGTPSPPPPPTVAAVDPDIRGSTTIREQLARHRADDSCNRCHRKIDPPGFALEGFDVIGGQREWYRVLGGGQHVSRLLHPQAPTQHVRYRQGPAVDSSGSLPDGRAFADIRDYRRLLLADETAMARSLTRILLSYSLGRTLGFSDRPQVEQIVAAVRSRDYGLRSIVQEIVHSRAFRSP